MNRPRVQHLSDKKKKLLRRIIDRNDDSAGQTIPPRNDDASEPPLSHVQERMWFLSQLAESYPNNLPSAVRLKGNLDIQALESAFNLITDRHEALRTTFPTVSGRPVQRIASGRYMSIPVKDFGHLPDKDRKPAFYNAAKAEILRPFDLAAEAPIRIRLYRLAGDDHLLLLIAHHIIWDGWSIGIFTGELALFYEAFAKGKTPDMPKPALQYADFAVWQRNYLTGSRLDRLTAFWKQTLGGVPDLTLPLDRPRPETQTFQGAMAPVFISRKTTERLTRLTQAHDATLFMTLMAAFNLLLFKYSDAEHIVVGSPTANRGKKEIEAVIGCFANIFVLCTDLSGNPTFAELIARTRETVLNAQGHQDLPFEMMVEHLNVRHDPGKNPIFQTMFGLHTTSLNELELPGLTLSPVPMDSDTTHFDLGLHLWLQDQALSGYISYRTDIFDESTIIGMRDHFERILGAALEDGASHISDITLLTEAERSALAAPMPPLPPADDIYQRFARVAAAHPHATAVIYTDKAGGHGSLSYSELDRNVRAFAAKLPVLVHGQDIRAAVRLPAGPEFAIAVLGILKADGTLTLLDPDLPQPATAGLADAFGINFVVTITGDGLPACTASLSMFFSDGLMAEPHNEASGGTAVCGASPDRPAFILGPPERGILVSHGRMLQRIDALQSRFSLSVRDTVIARGDTASHTLAWETLWPLLTGASLIISPNGQDNIHGGRNPDSHARRTLHLTPGELSTCPASGLVSTLHPADQVLISGGPLPQTALAGFLRQTRAAVTYMYTPPEAAFEAGFLDCRETAGTVHISNAAGVRLLDRFHQPVPAGVPGDIYLDAHGLTPVNDNGLIPDPLLPDRQLVKTCDRGRRTPGQTLVLLPVSRERVWQKGQRFHPGAVASALQRHPLVADCHIARQHDALTAYTVTRGPLNRPRRHLSAYLPPSMMPERYLSLNQLPLGPGGLPDAAALMRLDNTEDSRIHRWETAIQAIPEVDQVKVFRQEVPVRQRQIHISDILPEKNDGAAPSVQPEKAPGTRPLPPAFSDGGPLDIPEAAPATLGQALVKTASDRGHLGIVVVQEEGEEIFTSYADLLDAGKRILTGLQARGLVPGDRVILQLADMTAYFKSFWACMLGGVIPVTIAVDTHYAETSGVVKKLWNSWKLLDCPPVIAETDTAAALAGVPALFRKESGGKPFGDETPFAILDYAELAANDPDARIHTGRSGDVAFHQLTSGSTGIPKCVQITNSGAIHYIHGALSFGNTDTDITLNWLPMDHVVPLLTCHLKDVYLGNQQVQVHPRLVLANPLLWLDLLERHGCTYTWSPNFGFKLLTDALNEAPDRTWDISPLKFLLTGGEQITLPVIADIHRQLTGFGMDPDAMRSGYGMAEIGTVVVNPNVLRPETSADRFLKSSLNSVLEPTDTEGEASAVFMKLGPARAGVQFRIVDDDNRQVNELTIGNLQVRGGIVTPGYLNNDAVNREAFAGDGWFNTGDCAFIRNGILTITGRVKETIIICGANYYCYEIEDIVNDIPGVEPTFSAAVAVDNPRMGSESLAVFFVPKAWADDAGKARHDVDIALIRSVRNKVGKELGISPEHVIPMAKSSFPKTTSGKLQRTDLKKGLDRGEFNDTIKKIELAGESRNTVPDWFFEKTWIKKAAACHPVEGRRACLVFTSDAALFNAITAKQPGHYIRIEPGNSYQNASDGCYTIRPACTEDYERLLTDLKRQGVDFGRILHLLAYGPFLSETDPAGVSRAMNNGARSLLCLYRAVSSLTAADRPGHWLTVGTGIADVRPEDAIAVEHAPLTGLVNVLDQELPGMHCRLADIPVDKPEVSAGLILREASAHGDRITAYRDTGRYVPRLARIKFSPRKETVFKPGSLILISGGLGGVGIEVARHLLNRYSARLILVGQTPLPEETDQTQESSTTADQARLAHTLPPDQRPGVLKSLRQLGGEVIYEAADVGDPGQMTAVRDRAVQQFGRELDGIIHLAGTFPTRMLAEETVDTFDRTLRPKVNGALVLERLLPPDGFFITFSSLFTFFGGLGVGAYTAANSFLEGFCHHLRRNGRPESYCFGWTVWDDTGMSKGFQLKAQSRANGYHQIPPQKGMISFMAGLHSRHHSPMIGLDPARPAVSAAILHRESRPTHSLTAAYTTRDSSPCDGRFRMLDIDCGVRHLAEMPLDKQGKIDLGALERAGDSRSAKGRGNTEPGTSYEKTIGAIWREVLEVEDVGIHDTFFELGGQSILLVKTQTKLQQMFNRDISIVELLRYPTISTLAKYLEEGKKRQGFDKVRARAEKLKQKRTQRTRPKGRRPSRPARRATRRGK